MTCDVDALLAHQVSWVKKENLTGGPKIRGCAPGESVHRYAIQLESALCKYRAYLIRYELICYAVCSHVRLSVIPWTVGPLCPCDSPRKNTGVCFHSLLQGIFPTWELTLDLLHYRQILYHLSHNSENSIKTERLRWEIRFLDYY